MSPWWEALKWQQWSLRHRDYVDWEHISNWWVKGILIIFRSSDSFSVQNLISNYFLHHSVTEVVMPKASPLSKAQVVSINRCLHNFYTIFLWTIFWKLEMTDKYWAEKVTLLLMSRHSNPMESCLLANENPRLTKMFSNNSHFLMHSSKKFIGLCVNASKRRFELSKRGLSYGKLYSPDSLNAWIVF